MDSVRNMTPVHVYAPVCMWWPVRNSTVPQWYCIVQGKKLHARNHTNKHPLGNATDNPLDNSSNNPLGKWLSFGTYRRNVKCHWQLPLKIHDDFWGVDFWRATFCPFRKNNNKVYISISIYLSLYLSLSLSLYLSIHMYVYLYIYIYIYTCSTGRSSTSWSCWRSCLFVRSSC